VLKELRAICASFPETSEAAQFGHPVWRVGKKVFAHAYCYRGDLKLQLAFWVGVDQQALLIRDKQFSIPAYLGHNGWVAVDVSKTANWKEIRSLALFSYRHFALTRILKQLDAAEPKTHADKKKKSSSKRTR